jgi:hypothetical protein
MIPAQNSSYDPSNPDSPTVSANNGSGLDVAYANITPDVLGTGTVQLEFGAVPVVGTTVTTVHTPGLSHAYEQVFTAQNVAEGPWVEVPLDSAGNGSFAVTFMNPGDYLNVVDDSNNVTWQGWSAQAIAASASPTALAAGNGQPNYSVGAVGIFNTNYASIAIGENGNNNSLSISISQSNGNSGDVTNLGSVS